MEFAEDVRRERSLECLQRLRETQDVDERLKLFEQVIRDADPDIRRRALGLGSAVLSDERLVAFLRDEADDVKRNAGLEMLKLRRRRAIRLAAALLEDGDPDVVVQAVLVLSHVRDLRAVDLLLSVLDHPDVHVVQEAVVGLGKLAHVRALPRLVALLTRETWIQLAAVEALGRLRSTRAVPALEPLLVDPMASMFVIEALGRIGGLASYRALVRHWLRAAGDDLSKELDKSDLEPILRALGMVLDGLTAAPPVVPALIERIEALVRSEDKGIRLSAVRCLEILRQHSRTLMF
ncbi:MAG: HEAT repeat domain-containing protein [Acidobacteriota bacterium]